MINWTIGNKAVNSLTINNKEVRSIVRVSDGTTIYQKPSTPVVTVGSIVLTTTKNALSYKDGEYSDITATVYDNSATPQVMPNQQVVFKKGSTVLDTKTTNVNGECTYRYTSDGSGDVTIIVECQSITETQNIEDCWEITNVASQTAYVSNYYPSPLQITGTTKKLGSWGGTRINNAEGVLYVFLSQNSRNAHESEKIWYVLGSSYVDFKITIENNTVALYIDNSLVSSVNVDTTPTVRMWGGSSANKVDLRNVKIKAL